MSGLVGAVDEGVDMTSGSGGGELSTGNAVGALHCSGQWRFLIIASKACSRRAEMAVTGAVSDTMWY